jgi:heme/copper-type cytochrome/quinol oxidase subunit 3
MLNNKNFTTKHPFHIITPSPWPFLVACQVFVLLVGVAMYMHKFQLGKITALIGLFTVMFSLYCWWSDIVFESTHLGQHTLLVQKGLRYGMLLFILSEVMFFASFFWAFFHSSISPTVQIGSIWPPAGVKTIQAWGLPLFNTILLLTSGVYATLAHHLIKGYGIQSQNGLSIIANPAMFKQYISDKEKKISYKNITLGFFLSIMLGLLFTYVQLHEYKIAGFTIADSIYGAVFYMATGFHGLHVIIGTTFLIITFYRFLRGDFLGRFFFGVDAAVWYWHFVDVVWIFLFICVYWWGS